MFTEWANQKIRKMNWVDIGLLKICVFSFTLMIVQFVPVLFDVPWYWYGLVFTVTYFYLVFTVFGFKK
ncbi:MAG: hypothetical protein AB7S78_02950 [Candidatus Omnitrophota bacterium]